MIGAFSYTLQEVERSDVLFSTSFTDRLNFERPLSQNSCVQRKSFINYFTKDEMSWSHRAGEIFYSSE